jgi:hypothetical protein
MLLVKQKEVMEVKAVIAMMNQNFLSGDSRFSRLIHE